MGRISRENIEEFLLDYIEGNLDKNTHEEVKAFLLLNPDIEESLYGTDLAYLKPQKIQLPDKSKLKASLSFKEFEDKCILAIENELEAKDKELLKAELASNKTKMEIMNQYQKTIFSPDKSVVFDNKNALKRTLSFKFRKTLYYSTAAAIVLFISVSSLFMKKQNINEQNIIDFYIPVASEITQENIIEPKIPEPSGIINIVPSKQTKAKPKKVIVVPQRNISKIPTIEIIPNTEKLLAQTVFNSPEPNEIIIADTKYSMADQREFCLNHNAMEWSDNKKKRKKKNNQYLNSIIEIGESKIKTLLSRYVNTTRISHESTKYVAESRMD